ncbi:MAG: 2-oxoglutarate ferredoxin oxidoreductase subunit gamma [Bacillota bacterium]|jgi:2-oxoglutarate ferredoxin oxidoreductase subunit gamma|nr:2-oxoglutarate ferredoxin oxidoreductase subunit gamma [Bacillota bacterium]MDK2855740.1 2-oxoglutarate ferredoxin oxidoreductase subunit gamma [Bacillota bacterium]MDK2924680.1 2-oxoglutarate ferredoxin oxidoreductase subunit gamma [Bacillota bacterium]
MQQEFIFAGFGGQGVLLMGQLIAYAALYEGKKVSWIPSYGPEMRGGTANCTVVVSDREIGSPVVTRPSCVVAMNLPSLDKFEDKVKPGGVLVINSSMINREPRRTDITVIKVPATATATELGNQRVANMVALGAVVEATRVVSVEGLVETLRKKLPAHHQDLLPLNQKAIEVGRSFVPSTV